jgi:hypothetical protein
MKIRAFPPAILAIALMAAACQGMHDAKPRIDLWGDPASTSAATRTVVIGPGTKYVNVAGGEIIQFIVGDTAFAWNFDSAQDIPVFDLKLIAPPKLLDHQVLIYVAPNPLYMKARSHWGMWR